MSYVSEEFLILNEEWFARNKEEDLKKFLPRLYYIYYKWKDVINFYKLPVYSEIDKNIKEFIHGIKIVPYKFRAVHDVYHHYVGMIDKRDTKILERSPAHGTRFWMKTIRKNRKLLDSIEFDKLRNDHIYFKSSKDLQIPIWISVGLHGILTPREEIALILGTIYNWKHYEWTLSHLHTKKKDLYTNILDFLPIIGNLVAVIMELYFAIRYNWILRNLEVKATTFVYKCGYGEDYLNLIKKSQYGIRLNSGSLSLLRSSISAILWRVNDFLIKIFPPLINLSDKDVLKRRSNILRGIEKNEEEIKSFFNTIDFELSTSLEKFLKNGSENVS